MRAGIKPSARYPTASTPCPRTRRGWWAGGARPSDPIGIAVVAGHVGSARVRLGAFAAPRDIDVGDAVTVRAADGTAREFVATDVLEFGNRTCPPSCSPGTAPH